MKMTTKNRQISVLHRFFAFVFIFQLSLISLLISPSKIYAALATGGTITTDGEYTIHTFLSSGTFTPSVAIDVEYLVVAGGASGASNNGGGGGAGGSVQGTGHGVTATGYTIVVGGGGVGTTAGNGQNGGNSSFDGLTGIGGGRGGRWTHGGNGGCGGGTGYQFPLNGGTGSQGYNGGSTTDDRGYRGSAGGGMGGTGGSNISPSNGGIGLQNDISGTNIYYSGGGAGGNTEGADGVGGLGGGGDADGGYGTDGLGGGGAGGGSGRSGDGGSGIIIIRYLEIAVPTIGVPTILSTTSIRWNFTDNSSVETGFKVYDNGTPTLKVTCASADLTYCDETSLSINTQYTRKVVAYDGGGNSAYSSTATKYTLATVPSAPTVNTATATTLDINPNPNGSPTSTEMVVYKETGATCDGVGGSFIVANGSDNGSTPVWQAESSWSTVTATGLSENTQYSFCTKSRNGDNTETTYGSAGSGTTTETDAPSISSITSVAGDTTFTYYDSTNDLSTEIIFVSTDGAGGGVSSCKWDTADTDYESMSSSCATTSSCTTDLSGEGVKTVYIRCSDIYSNKMTSSQTVNYTIDSVTPTISTAEDSIPDETTVTITWSTDEASSTQLEYGLTTSYGSTTTEIDTSTRVTNHSDSISSLQSCTSYHYRVISKDAATNTLTGTDQTFTTIGCSGSSVVEAETSGTVTKATGGEVDLQEDGDSKVKLTIPANFSTTDADFQVKRLDKDTVILSTSTPSTDVEAIGDHVYQLDALSDNSTRVTTFDEAISITMTYTAAQIAGFDESSLLIYRWDGSDWYTLDSCVVDTAAMTVTCETTSFSTFILFGEETASSSTSSSGSSSSNRSCDNFAPGVRPDLFQVNTTATSATLYFAPLLDSSSFHISYSTNPLIEEHAVRVTLAREGVQNFTIGYLKPNTIYYFRLRGMDDCGFGEWSSAMKVKTNNKGTISSNNFYKYGITGKIISYFTNRQVSNQPDSQATKPSVLGKKSIKASNLLLDSVQEAGVTNSEANQPTSPEDNQWCFLWWCF